MLPTKIKINKTMLRTMATMRANGTSWDAVAEKVGKPATELEDLVWKHETIWYKYLKKAEKALFHEALSESVLSLRGTLRGDDKRLRVQASNAMVRLWHTQNPKPRIIKKAKEEVLNERQKHYRHQADCLARMTPERVNQQDERDAQKIFLARLNVYLYETPELLQAVKEIADIDDYGHPKNTNGPDKCGEIAKKALEKWLEKNPHLSGKPQPPVIPTLSPNGPGGGPPKSVNQPNEEAKKPKFELPRPEFNTFYSLLFMVLCGLWAFVGGPAQAQTVDGIVVKTQRAQIAFVEHLIDVDCDNTNTVIEPDEIQPAPVGNLLQPDLESWAANRWNALRCHPPDKFQTPFLSGG